MKKFICAVVLSALIFSVLDACGSNADVGNNAEHDAVGGTDAGKSFSVVTTIFPEYDWVRQILGGNAENVSLTLLLGNGVDLHSYQPTVDDMVKISTCDLFLYVGGESDKWVNDALATAANQNMAVVNLLEILGDAVKEEEAVEGMQTDKDEGGAEDETEYDEHIWLSLKNAVILCGRIAEALEKLDPSNAADYAANAEIYIEQLTALDAQYAAAVDAASVNTILFGDRFPFRYLADDYGLNYYAAFAGCSAETEASFETVIFLSNKVDELNLPAVLTIENGDGKIARTIVENTAAKSARILQLDSMQSVTSHDVLNGADYLGTMERNLEVLRDALQ